MLTMEKATKTDPYMAILGRPSAATNLAAQQSQSGQNTLTPGFFSGNTWNAQNDYWNRMNFDRTGAWRDQAFGLASAQYYNPKI